MEFLFAELEMRDQDDSFEYRKPLILRLPLFSGNFCKVEINFGSGFVLKYHPNMPKDT